MRDSFGREITYLRLSVTERCQLRCEYCRAAEGKCPKRDELSREQLKMIVAAAAQNGINKVRLTGGEPLIRKDIVEIAADCCNTKSIISVNITTNGQLLEEHARPLKEAGVCGVNVSLDSLKPERFHSLTGGELDKTLAGLDAAVSAGFERVKLNAVLVRGRNDDEIEDFFALARELPVDLRFIELMPLSDPPLPPELMIPSDEIIASHPELRRIKSDPCSPSRDYHIDGCKGNIGFISAVSHKFCESCNRIRVTSAGALRPCLGHNEEINLLDALSEGQAALSAKFKEAIEKKPAGHLFGCGFRTNSDMRSIGG